MMSSLSIELGCSPDRRSTKKGAGDTVSCPNGRARSLLPFAGPSGWHLPFLYLHVPD